MLWGLVMTILRINAIGNELCLHGGFHPLRGTLNRALKQPGPLVIMVHGYRFQPNDPIHCPHAHIFSSGAGHRCPKALSWPRHLGFARGNPEEGVAIAFGWYARGNLAEALAASHEAARALARLISLIRASAPERKVNLVAHSMGAHLALLAMMRVDRGDIARVIVLNAATYQNHAIKALNSPGGRSVELFNITSRENSIYDFLYERALPSTQTGDRTLAHGLTAPNSITIRIDHPGVRRELAALGYPIASKLRWFCHWSTYLRPGVFPFYSALLRMPERLPMPLLRSRLMPLDEDQTWGSSTQHLPRLLPAGRKQAS